MASLISGAINSAAWTGAGLIPMFVVGLAYLRYSMYDPESRVIDVKEVSHAGGTAPVACSRDGPLSRGVLESRPCPFTERQTRRAHITGG